MHKGSIFIVLKVQEIIKLDAWWNIKSFCKKTRLDKDEHVLLNILWKLEYLNF